MKKTIFFIRVLVIGFICGSSTRRISSIFINGIFTSVSQNHKFIFVEHYLSSLIRRTIIVIDFQNAQGFRDGS